MKKKETGELAPGSVPAPSARTKYTNEFKRMAVERMRQGTLNPTELAVELGIRRNQLYKWANALDAQLPGEDFKTPGRPLAGEMSEMERLRRELATAQEELAILKKFDAYLTRHKR